MGLSGPLIFFPDIYAYSPGKDAHNFGFKIHEVQKGQKWCNYAHVEKNRSKNRNLSNAIYLCFFEDTGIDGIDVKRAGDLF